MFASFKRTTYEHELLVFRSSNSDQSPILVCQDGSCHVRTVQNSSLSQVQLQLKGQVILTTDAQLEILKAANEAVASQDTASQLSMELVCTGVVKNLRDKGGERYEVYLGKTTTSKKTLLFNPDDPTS